MMKITEIKVNRKRIINEADGNGRVVRKEVNFSANRPVKVIDSGKRFAHFFVDLIVIQVIWYCIDFLSSIISSPEDSMNFIISFGVFSFGLISMLGYPIYYIICEHLWQRTPGKFLTKSLVIDAECNKPDLASNILRNIIRLVPFEALSCLSNRGWHDSWSDTYVVTEQEHEKLLQLLNEQSQEK